jgi:peptidyl-prolyl cis-trans isomerase D
LADLQQGKDAGVTFSKPLTLKRNQPQPGVPAAALGVIFQVDASKLPAYTGSVNERGGFSLFRVQKVIAPPPADAAKVTAFMGRVGDQVGRELASAYVASLRAKSDVKINEAAVEGETETGSGPKKRLPRRR